MVKNLKKNVIAIKTLIFEIGWIFKRKYKYLGLNNYLKGNLESLKDYHGESRSWYQWRDGVR